MPDQGLDQKGVANALKEVALLLELKGENPFKVRAYLNAARSIETLEEDWESMVQQGRLRDIAGVGEALARQIAELVTTGRLDLLEELKRAVPPGHLEMLKIPGLGPKKIKALYDTLGLETIGQLEYACLENRLIELQGFGRRTQEKILQGIQQVKRYQGRYLYGEAIHTAEEVLRKVLSSPDVLRASLAGSLRRRMEIVRNINLMVSTPHPQQVLKMFSQFPDVEVAGLGDGTRGRFSLQAGIEIDLQTTSESLFPYGLYHLTGSLSHWHAMCARASAMGWDLSERGLRRGSRVLPCKEEGGIFDALGLDFIPPELREGQGEIEAAEAHRIPRLIEDPDIQGVFHVHSHYSDGTNSIRAVAEAAKRMGLSYIGVSDHSQSARYAGGLTPQQLRRQSEEIDQLNGAMEGFHIFKGTESDIQPDGSLDYEEGLLKKFDFVIASVHSHFTMSSEEMTRRVIKALRNPYTTILAHPTGRLLLAREPYAINMTSIIDEAAKTGVAIELNAHPFRLDIDWRLCRYAKDRGVKIVIDPDSHHEEGLKDTYFGVGIARKGWLEPGDILNTLPLEEMKDFLERRRPWTQKGIRRG